MDVLRVIFSHSKVLLLLLCKNVEKLYIKIESKKEILNINFKKYLLIVIVILCYNKNISDKESRYLTYIRHLDLYHGENISNVGLQYLTNVQHINYNKNIDIFRL